MARGPRSTAKKRQANLAIDGLKISSSGNVKWSLKFDEHFHPKNFLPLMEKDGKYYINGKELPLDHPEEWQSIIFVEMAKSYLK